MSGRERGVNEDAPRVGTDERRDDQAESRAEESAPRRVGDVRQEREAERHQREAELGTTSSGRASS